MERLIRPTIIGPLRDEWDAVRVAAATLHDEAHQAENQADPLQAAATAKLAAGASAEAKQLGTEAVRLRKDKEIHDKGLVSILKQIHDDLDAAESLEQQLLTRLVALNHERAAEEKRGLIRWLRPDFQAPQSSDGDRPPLQGEIDDDDTSENSKSNIQNSTSLPDWPAELPAQVAALRKLLPIIGQNPDPLAACFGRKSQKRSTQISAILDTLKALGHIT